VIPIIAESGKTDINKAIHFSLTLPNSPIAGEYIDFVTPCGKPFFPRL
jgi:hypothetical protein